MLPHVILGLSCVHAALATGGTQSQFLDTPIDPSAASEVRGVVVIARNGDRHAYYQDPTSYRSSDAETTALGEVQSHELGSTLRQMYFSPESPLAIEDMSAALVDTTRVKVLAKSGGEGSVVFDSAIALLQGLFPPTEKNRIQLANGKTVVAPLGGYQYVPVETVEPVNDRSLESWTNCPAFETHVAKFHASDAFKAKAKDAQPFLNGVRDYVFGFPLTLENAARWNINEFVSTRHIHNQTYAYRLPPTFPEQARSFANFRENGVFASKQIHDIANIPGRTLLADILHSLERIAFNADPLQFMLVETSYQAFISLFAMTQLTREKTALAGIPNFASAIAIELRRGPAPDYRDFLRFRFKNGTEEAFNAVHAFGHVSDIPLTEFIFRTQEASISNNAEWARVCAGREKHVEVSASAAGGYVELGRWIGMMGLVCLFGGFCLNVALSKKKAIAKKAAAAAEEEGRVIEGITPQKAGMMEKGLQV